MLRLHRDYANSAPASAQKGQSMGVTHRYWERGKKFLSEGVLVAFHNCGRAYASAIAKFDIFCYCGYDTDVRSFPGGTSAMNVSLTTELEEFVNRKVGS